MRVQRSQQQQLRSASDRSQLHCHCQHCQANTEGRKRPKDSAVILHTADMFALLPGHYGEGNGCDVCLRSIKQNIRM